MKDFLKHYIKDKKGKVLNEKGEEIGFHDGAVFYTLGERHGFTITQKSPKDGAYYIVQKDVQKNILYVSQNKNFSRSDLGEVENFCRVLRNVNWISEVPKANKIYTAQIRYHGEFLSCKIKCSKNFEQEVEVIFKKLVLIAAGQSCVVYDKDICLGGGVIV